MSPFPEATSAGGRFDDAPIAFAGMESADESCRSIPFAPLVQLAGRFLCRRTQECIRSEDRLATCSAPMSTTGSLKNKASNTPLNIDPLFPSYSSPSQILLLFVPCPFSEYTSLCVFRFRLLG